MEFWERTRLAWAAGELSWISTIYKETANKKHLFAIDSENLNLTKALDALRPRSTEILIVYEEFGFNWILTNQRLILRKRKKDIYNVFELSDISKYSHSHFLFWSVSMTIILRDGTMHAYSGLGSYILPEIINSLIDRLKNVDSKQKTKGENYSYRSETETVDETMPETELECAKVLGIHGEVTLDVVKQRWRVLSQQYHPDKVQHLGPKLRELAEKEMKHINAARDFFQSK